MNNAVDLQPTLRGKIVTVRPIAASDWDGMYAAASDAKIWEQHPASDRYQERVFRQYFDDAIACGSAFAFVDNASGDIIGSSRYHGHDPVAREIEIGWTFLARACWGGRYNSEIKQLMLDHAFTFVDTVVFWIGETNMRSRRSVEKLGGVLREGIYRRDPADEIAHVVYAIRAAS